MNAEFDLIDRIRARASHARADVALGIGDDAAILRVPAGHDLVVSTDTLNSGVHFPAKTDAFDIGWKSLAVNLSDLAAMGAQPAWCTLNLTVPDADGEWLDAFLDGFLELASQHAVALVGGDITRGPMSITVTVHGLVAHDKALLRSGANVGDDIWISGTLGDAAAGLELLSAAPPLSPSPRAGDGLGVMRRAGELPMAVRAPKNAREGRTGGASDCQAVEALSATDAHRQPQQYDGLLARLDRPTPRVALGIALHEIATACIDISDGLLADLGHVVVASNVGAEITIAALPTSADLSKAFDRARRVALQLGGGDDYELCFTAAQTSAPDVVAAGVHGSVAVTRIGRIEAQSGLRLCDADGAVSSAPATGYRHFASMHAQYDK